MVNLGEIYRPEGEFFRDFFEFSPHVTTSRGVCFNTADQPEGVFEYGRSSRGGSSHVMQIKFFLYFTIFYTQSEINCELRTILISLN